MKYFSLLALIALMTKESQQINLNSKWGVLDLKEGDDGSDPMFAHMDVSKDEEQQNSMDSLREAEAEMKKAAKEKEEAARKAELEKNANSTMNVTANITAYMNMMQNQTA